MVILFFLFLRLAEGEMVAYLCTLQPRPSWCFGFFSPRPIWRDYPCVGAGTGQHFRSQRGKRRERRPVSFIDDLLGRVVSSLVLVCGKTLNCKATTRERWLNPRNFSAP